MKKLGKGIKRSMAMGLMHRWQNKDPFEVKTVPWSGERKIMRRPVEIGLQSRLSAMGATGGVGMGRIIGFSSGAGGGGAAKGIEAPKEEGGEKK